MKFGIPYLFLSPEYLGEVSWLSFLILGFSIGGFFMAFHLYSYILMGPSFPFIATLSRPFYKFCINNSVIPIIFYFTLIYNVHDVQSNEELMSFADILIQCAALTGGMVLFLILSVLYFFRTNWDISKLQLRRKAQRRSFYFLVGSLFARKKFWFESHHARVYHPSFYLASLKKILPARDSKHYKREVLQEVFRQNQLNASLFEIIIIVSFFVLGYFGEYGLVQIPSSASFMLLCTFAIMIITIFYTWFKGWAISVIAVSLLMLNVISSKTDWLQVKNYAYGLNYSTKNEYNLEALKELQYDTLAYQNDILHHENILDNWYEKASRVQQTEKPKLVLVNCSGGGLRSAMWSFYVMQQLDIATENKFFQNVHFITGASGGMVGASYYRELELLSQTEDVDQRDDKYLQNISKDLLNSTAFNMVMHDVFMRYKTSNINGQEYVQDRGFAFESQLNVNTEFVLDKRLIDYRKDEMRSTTPLMLFSPTIINDGRRLIMAAQPYGFMNGTIKPDEKTGPENIEYLKLFNENLASSVQFTSILRMNSTFPYVLPMVTLPTSPEIQVMDAGIRDNYGTKSTMRYITAMEDWIMENTSGVVLLELRDIQKDYDIEKHNNRLSLGERFIKPISNFYGNYHHSQEYNATELVDELESSNIPVDVVTFVLRKDPSEMISLSWHLTQREKNDIKRIFNSDYNQSQMNFLIDLLKL
ncbi:MAG: hypothetical protein ABJG68_14925 [Crocinitomicaceae bacterium]